MRRVHEQCVAQRSTEAIAQPAARRPEAQRGTRPKNLPQSEIKHLKKFILFANRLKYLYH
ncbi:MAG: hypothetical protein NZ455_03670 [Bacteroidia bacterium]|nr:hypothetical protein [Bacteroidia bacterium]